MFRLSEDFPKAGLTLAVCNDCQVIRLLPAENFPRSGWWLECPACKKWAYFWMVERPEHKHNSLSIVTGR